MYENLLKPIKIGKLTLKNRMIQPGMGTNLAAADGTVSDSIVAYYSRRAEGGIAMIITEVCCPEPRGRVIPGELEVSNYSFVPGLSRLVNAAHAGGAKIALQLAHGGCFASQSVTGFQPISPSGVGTMLLPNDQPKAMTTDEIKELVKAYGEAAMRAKIARFDAIEIHGAHGYMPLQFLSGYTNRRTDEYGGSLENRARFALEVIRSVKEHTAADFPVIYRLSAEEDVEGGVTLDEAMQFAVWAVEAGVDALHISAGTWDSRIGTFFGVLGGQVDAQNKRLHEGVSIGMWVPPLYTPRGNLVRLAEAIKKKVNIPVITVCGLTPEMGEEIVATNKADIVSFGRQMIADPDFPNKIQKNKPEEIRRCVRCNECLGSVLSYRGFDCAVNPQAAKEHEEFCKIIPTQSPKKVMVIGGGPSGMEAARVATLRGHSVTLYEKSSQLGGLLPIISAPKFKEDYKGILNWQVSEIERQKINVHLNTEVTKELIDTEKPDAIIVATGSSQKMIAIKGDDLPNVVGAIDVFKGKIPEGKNIVVLGTGIVGAETAMYLQEEHQKQVTVLEQLPNVNLQLEIFSQWTVQGRMAQDGIKIITDCAVNQITTGEVICTQKGEQIAIKADGVVNALGIAADKKILEIVQASKIEHIATGDVVAIRNVLSAIHEGYHAGRRI